MEFVVSNGVGVGVVGGVYNSGIFDNVGNGCCVGGAYGRIGIFLSSIIFSGLCSSLISIIVLLLVVIGNIGVSMTVVESEIAILDASSVVVLVV